MTEACQRDLVELGLSAIIRQASHPKLAIQSLALKSPLLPLKKPGSLLSFATAHRHHYASSILILNCFVSCAENRPAIEAAGGEEKLRALTTSTNRAVAAASAHALQLLHSS